MIYRRISKILSTELNKTDTYLSQCTCFFFLTATLLWLGATMGNYRSDTSSLKAITEQGDKLSEVTAYK